VTTSTESGNKDFIVFVDVVKTTVIGYVCSHLLSVFLQKHSATLTDSGVRLLGFHSEFFYYDSFSMGGPGERFLVLITKMSFVVVLISPKLEAATIL